MSNQKIFMEIANAMKRLEERIAAIEMKIGIKPLVKPMTAATSEREEDE